MKALVLRDGKLVNTVLVPDGWPDIEGAWQPPEGCTAEIAKGQTYPPADPVAAERTLEDMKAFAVEELLKYVAAKADAPQAVKDFTNAIAAPTTDEKL